MEKKFPIYRFTFKWNQKEKDSSGEDSRKGNGTSFTKMFRNRQTDEELNNYRNSWWNYYFAAEENMGLDLQIDSMETEYVGEETWHLTWFTHETFDLGQSDEEVLESFEKFVQSKEELNRRSHGRYGDGEYCLMGAEDRWRWRGSEDKPAPCRCEHCKEQGVIRISH